MANTTTTSTNTITLYNDTFDVVDETNDGLQFSADILNQYFLSGQLQSTIYQEEKINYEILNDMDSIEIIQDEETILSQKLSQLSTKNKQEMGLSSMIDKKRRHSSATSPCTTSKKIKTAEDSSDEDDDIDIQDTNPKEQIPNYLTINHLAFVRMNATILKQAPSITVTDLQEMAFFMHQIEAIRMKKVITNIYLKSVTGTLTEPELDLIEVDRRVYPMQVKSLLLAKQPKTTAITTTTTTTMEMNEPDQQSACEKLIHQRLEELQEEMQYYEKKLLEKKNSLTGYTLDMNETLQKFVQEYGIKPLELKYQLKKTIVIHDFELEILERKYNAEKPNEYQNEIVKRLSTMRRQVEKSKRAMMELKQGVFFHKSSVSFDSIQLSTSSLNDTNINNQGKQKKFLNQYEYQLRCKKLDLIALHLPQAELTYYRFQAEFDTELASMWKNHRNFVKDQGMIQSLLSLLEKRLASITNRWRDIYNYRIDYYLQNAYDELDHSNPEEITQYVKIMSPSSSIMIDAQHPLNEKQLQLLSRGPNYVPPCFMYTTLSYESMGDIVKKQYAPFKHTLNNLFLKYKLNLNLQMEIHKKVYDLFQDLFSKSIPSDLFQRAQYEKKLIESIRFSFQKHNIILRRTADNMNIFYMGNREEFEKKADRYLLTSENYDLLFDTNDTNSEKPLNMAIKDMIESMNALLEKLKIHKAITMDLYKQFMADPTNIKIPYLYFLPNISNENVMSLVPIVTSQYSITWKIAKYLNKLLRPYADGVLRSTSFFDENDFIRKLYRYANVDCRLRPSTIFCSIKITNFYTLDEHEEMIDVIGYFLQDNLATNKLEPLTIQTIRNLLHLFLHNNIFSYKNSIYKFTKGSPNTIPLTETLSNIYLFMWQKKILKEVNQNIELFGRYKDQIFFTWSKSTAIALEAFIEDLREQNGNVRFQKLIGPNVSFLNAYIENRQGQLYSRVHHDFNMPRYILPYVTGHTKSCHSGHLFLSLIRAVCYCTSVDDFQQERIYLEITYLINGYSLLFLETHVKRFFNYFDSETMRFSYNQNSYHKFRQLWFQYVQQRQEQSQQLQKFDDTNCLFQFDYIYDFGPKCRFNREFRRLWHDYFQHHPTLSEDNCHIILNPKNFHSLNSLLGMDKPSTSLASTQSSTSSSIDSETNERNLSQQIRTTDVKVNLIDCMKCYVRIPRCTFEQQACNCDANTNRDMVQEVEEFRQEQEQDSPKQVNKKENENSPTTKFIYNISNENEITSLIVIDLPWSQTSQPNTAADV
ncbi:unnamed protein product [Rotaria sp. Silwood2]|nr:unnamed protein product [Rotaria sp. Silwood2]CAF3283000.1 unnamed protein product [Rotaria sp. Silwood2]CAF4114038.1 unnamed protein product [Rotaria sp. Silwood2]CAF4148532.1 unnamed protein product [Rotaria sp. Silwood2]CAF4210987.1 unnamed protein product [Rotaria sp. Silwood2]